MKCQGGDIICRKQLILKCLKRFSVKGFAEPHNSIPYVHSDCIIELYLVSLLDRDSLEFMSGLRRGSLEFTIL